MNRIVAALDRPAPGEVQYGRLRVAGWAFATESPVYRVEVLVDGRVVAFAASGGIRPDVAALHDAYDAARESGFAARFELPGREPGTTAMLVRVIARDGTTVEFEREFYYGGPFEATLPWNAAKLDTRALDEVRAIAFYLPQYHPIPENDRWWGPGFTEWSNVTRARPALPGHHQPHLPADLGFYDLRNPETREAQAALARANGIDGFCYYHYWFGGKRLLERPFDEVLEYKTPQFPFCLCWANENWTRRWDGADSDVLIGQRHSPEDDVAFIRDIEPALRDARYIRADGKPLLIVYRVGLLPDPAATVARWRQECRRSGVGELYILAVQAFDLAGDPRDLGFDGSVEFPPNGFSVPNVSDRYRKDDPDFAHHVYEYRDFVEQVLSRELPAYPLHRTVFPSWDNTARRKSGASIFVNSSPEAYRLWLAQAKACVAATLPPGHRFVFVNAWNEWAEGCHLEPDQKYGDTYLNVTREVMHPQLAIERRPKISVVIPAYNHARYIYTTLRSIKRQTTNDYEVVLVDDGSLDDTLHEVARFRREHPDFRIRVFAQSNSGAHAALNFGISQARGRYIAPLNSDDLFEPERLETMLAALRDAGSEFGFSGILAIDDDGQNVGGTHPYAMALLNKQAAIGSYPSIGFAMLDFNVTISTGNFFFSRALYDRVGPFSALRYCHDWDFALSALCETEPVYVPKRLYGYRLHHANSYLGLQDHGVADCRVLLRSFFGKVFDGSPRGQYFPSRENWPVYFDSFVRPRGLEEFLPKEQTRVLEAR